MPGLCRHIPFSGQSAGQSTSGWRLAHGPLLHALPPQHGCCAPTAHLASPLLHTICHPKRDSQLGSCAALSVCSAGSKRTFLPNSTSYQPPCRLGSLAPLRHTPKARPPSAVPELVASFASSPYRDYYVVGLAAVGAVLWVKIFDHLAANGIMEQKLSRKVVHTTTGPIFVLTWALFSAAPTAKFLAAVVPMLNLARLLAIGSGLLSDPGLVKSVSRSGDRAELLKGPLYYVVTLIAATTLCWRDNPAGLIAVAMMCGGDGLADIVGRRWGATAKLPYNRNKSWAGSAAMLVGGYGMSYGLVTLFCRLGFFACYPPSTMFSSLGAVALAATLVESLPIDKWVDDNVSVPGVAAVLSLLLLPQPVTVGAAAGAVGVSVAAGAAAAVGMVM